MVDRSSEDPRRTRARLSLDSANIMHALDHQLRQRGLLSPRDVLASFVLEEDGIRVLVASPSLRTVRSSEEADLPLAAAGGFRSVLSMRTATVNLEVIIAWDENYVRMTWDYDGDTVLLGSSLLLIRFLGEGDRILGHTTLDLLEKDWSREQGDLDFSLSELMAVDVDLRV